LHSEATAPEPSFLQSEDALESFLRRWENGQLSKAEWTHAAHVAVAACYTWDHDAGEAFTLMKAGIIRHNTAVGTLNTEDSGYHETLTRLWTVLVQNATGSAGFPNRLEAVRAAVRAFGDDRKRYELYYSFDVVKDRRARREWVEPDLRPL
jgi:hypothetical protein